MNSKDYQLLSEAYASIQSEASMTPREYKKPTPTVPAGNPKPKDPPKNVRMESMVGGRGLPSPSGGSSTGPNLLDKAVDTATSVVKPPVQRQANKKFGPLGGVFAGREVDKIGSDVKSGNYGGALNRTVSGLGKLFNSADLFDIVKGHLMSEGYADTEEAALAIMANMSEEWRQSIVEQLDPDSTGGTYDDFKTLHRINDMMKKMTPAQKKKYLDGLPRVGADGKPLKGA